MRTTLAVGAAAGSSIAAAAVAVTAVQLIGTRRTMVRTRGLRRLRTAKAPSVSLTTLFASREPRQLKEELLSLCGEGLEGRARVEAAQRLEDVVAELVARACQRSVDEAADTLEGRWRLLNTFVPGQAAASITSLDSWRDYLFAKGPSPVQAGIFSSGATQRIYQTLDLRRKPGQWSNVVDALPFGVACIQADLQVEKSSTLVGTALRFQWTGGFISIRRFPFSGDDLSEPLQVPYPVPFALLGDRARGSFDTLFLDEDLHIARGTKSGSMFILVRESSSLPMETQYYNPQP